MPKRALTPRERQTRSGKKARQLGCPQGQPIVASLRGRLYELEFGRPVQQAGVYPQSQGMDPREGGYINNSTGL